MVFEQNVFLGKRFIITGGGSGLGQSLAVFLIEHGAKVVLLGRSLTRLQAMQSTYGDAVEVHECNIRDHVQVKSVMKACLNQRVHGLINNAAANFPHPTEHLSHNAFHAIFDTVASGTFYMTQAIGAHWLAQQQTGVVVSISATYGSGAGPYVVPSAMGKASLEAMTRSLAVEWGDRGIRLLAVAPGLIYTEGAWQHLFAEVGKASDIADFVPCGEPGTKEALNHLIALMLTDACPYLTGAVVPLDGAFALTSGSGPFYQWFKSLNEEQWATIKKVGLSSDRKSS